MIKIYIKNLNQLLIYKTNINFGVVAGTYLCDVLDDAGCSITVDVIIEQPDLLTISDTWRDFDGQVLKSCLNFCEQADFLTLIG